MWCLLAFALIPAALGFSPSLMVAHRPRILDSRQLIQLEGVRGSSAVTDNEVVPSRRTFLESATQTLEAAAAAAIFVGNPERAQASEDNESGDLVDVVR